MDKTTQICGIGFVTKKSLEVLSMPNHVEVYLPNAYDLAGILIIVHEEWVEPLDLPGYEVMKFNFSGGLTPIKGAIGKADMPDLDGAVEQ